MSTFSEDLDLSDFADLLDDEDQPPENCPSPAASETPLVPAKDPGAAKKLFAGKKKDLSRRNLASCPPSAVPVQDPFVFSAQELTGTLFGNNKIESNDSKKNPKESFCYQKESEVSTWKEVCVSKSEFARSHSRQELDEIGARELRALCSSQEMYSKLSSALVQNLCGYAAVFTGSPGGSKSEFLPAFADLLYRMGKTSSADMIRLPFSRIDEPLTENQLYVVSGFEYATIVLFGDSDTADGSNGEELRLSFQKKLDLLLSVPSSTYIILDCTEIEMMGFRTVDPRISYIYSVVLDFPDLSSEEIAKRFISALPPAHQKMVTPAFRQKVIAYLNEESRYYPFSNVELANYLATYASRFDQQLVLPPSKASSLSLDDALKSIVGLKDVKKQIYELKDYLIAQRKLEKLGIRTPPMNLHMLFLGSPGTGKTTMARIIAHLLFDMGYIPQDKTVEVSSKDLVDSSPAKTGIKTNKVIMKAMGGVLFVDEAYSLCNTGNSGDEAIAMLVKAMEDYKGKFVCMFAGYTYEMQSFIKKNSGIQSRINFVFEFQNYSIEELLQIYKIKLSATGMALERSAEDSVRQLCDAAVRVKNSGNGRFVDKMIQRTLVKHASRKDFDSLSASRVTLIDKKSIPTVEEIMATIGRG